MIASSVVAALSPVGGVLAAASDGFDPVSLLATGVTPTAVVLLIVFGWLVPKGQVKQLEAERDAARADAAQARAEAAQARGEHSALVDKVVDDVVPVLTRSVDATAASTAAVQELTRRAISGGG